MDPGQGRMDPSTTNQESEMGDGPQDTWKQYQQKIQWRGWRLGATVPIWDKRYKQNLEPNNVNSLYPTTHNTKNRFSLLATTNDNDDKTTIINNRTNKKMETA